jgi:large subunit ribosomal protein L21
MLTIRPPKKRKTMFAIIKTGGKQYRVQEGSILQVERIEASVGDQVSAFDVLAAGADAQVEFGHPFLNTVKVTAEILEQKRDKKVIVFKKIRRHNHRRKKGHRQFVSIIKIREIVAEGSAAESSQEGVE